MTTLVQLLFREYVEQVVFVLPVFVCRGHPGYGNVHVTITGGGELGLDEGVRDHPVARKVRHTDFVNDRIRFVHTVEFEVRRVIELEEGGEAVSAGARD